MNGFTKFCIIGSITTIALILGIFGYVQQTFELTIPAATYQNYMLIAVVAALAAWAVGYFSIRPIKPNPKGKVYPMNGNRHMIAEEETEVLEEPLSEPDEIPEPKLTKKTPETIRAEAAQAQLESYELPEEPLKPQEANPLIEVTRGAEDAFIELLKTIPVVADANGKKVYDKVALLNALRQQIAIASVKQIVDRIQKNEIIIDVQTLEDLGIKDIKVLLGKPDKKQKENGLELTAVPPEIPIEALEDD